MAVCRIHVGHGVGVRHDNPWADQRGRGIDRSIAYRLWLTNNKGRMANMTSAVANKMLGALGSLGTLQLTKKQEVKRGAANGGKRVIIETGGERIEYAGGFTRIEGRIPPHAQDSLEPVLDALIARREAILSEATKAYTAGVTAAKQAHAVAMAKLGTDRDEMVKRAISDYETKARTAILAATSPKGSPG